MKNEEIVLKLREIFGESRVISDKESVYGCSFDATFSLGEVSLPIAVVSPVTTQEVVELVKLANLYKIPIVPKGAGTNHCGACVSDGGIIVNFCKMNKITDLNVVDMSIRVEPGVVLGDLQSFLEERGLFFPPDPSNLRVSTMGGAIALSSGGSRTFKYGTTKDYILSLEVVLPSGDVVSTGSGLAKDVAGYDLTSLVVGSEGTLALVTQAVLKVIPKPQAARAMMVYFDDVKTLVESAIKLVSLPEKPAVIDFLDRNTLLSISKCADYHIKTDCYGALLVEYDGDADTVAKSFIHSVSFLRQFGACVEPSNNDDEYKKLWNARRMAYACSSKLAMNVISEDVAVSKSNLLCLITGIENIVSRYGLNVCILGHIADGNIHPNFLLDLSDTNQRKAFEAARDELLRLVIFLKGTISAEHGIGADKAAYLPLMFSNETVNLMKNIKNAFDPNNIFNPGKLLG